MPKAILITHEGQTLSRKEWSTLLRIPEPTIAWRHRQGMSAADILSTAEMRGSKGVPRIAPASKLVFKLPSRRDLPAHSRSEVRQPYVERKCLTFNGETRAIVDWARLLDLAPGTIVGRMREKMPIEAVLGPRKKAKKSIKSPKRPRMTVAQKTMLTLMGETMSVHEWACDLSICPNLILLRMKSGKTAEQCLVKPRSLSRRLSRVQGSDRAVMRVPTLAELDERRAA